MRLPHTYQKRGSEMTANVKRILVKSALFGILFYAVLAPIAYAQRGYFAFGGECMGPFWALFMLCVWDGLH